MVERISLSSRLLFPQKTKDPLFVEFLNARGLRDTPRQRMLEIGGSAVGIILVVVGSELKDEHLVLAISLAFTGTFVGFWSIRQGTLIKFREWLTTRQR
jgi:hypothetical protein